MIRARRVAACRRQARARHRDEGAARRGRAARRQLEQDDDGGGDAAVRAGVARRYPRHRRRRNWNVAPPACRRAGERCGAAVGAGPAHRPWRRRDRRRRRPDRRGCVARVWRPRFALPACFAANTTSYVIRHNRYKRSCACADTQSRDFETHMHMYESALDRSLGFEISHVSA